MENSRFQFRAWQALLKKMTYFNNPSLTFEMPEENKRQLIPILAFKLAEGSGLYLGNYGELMACAGFDKNGNPIFEHDILEYDFEDIGKQKAVVYWSEKHCGFLLEPLRNDFQFVYIGEGVVIGNTFENPELLHAKEAQG
jgi:hypothetical protein